MEKGSESTSKIAVPTGKPKEITNDVEALNLALRLAVSAPTDELSKIMLSKAREITSSLTEEQVDAVKAGLEVEMAGKSPAEWIRFLSL